MDLDEEYVNYKELIIDDINNYLKKKINNSKILKEKIKKEKIFKYLNKYNNNNHIDELIKNIKDKNIFKKIIILMEEYKCNLINYYKLEFNNINNEILIKELYNILEKIKNIIIIKNFNINKRNKNTEINTEINTEKIKKKRYYDDWIKEFKKQYNEIIMFINIPEDIKNNKREIIKYCWKNFKNDNRYNNFLKLYRNDNKFLFGYVNDKIFNCDKCNTIINNNKYNKCIFCEKSYYCSLKCQTEDWNFHKKNCIKIIKKKIKNNKKKNIIDTQREIIDTSDSDLPNLNNYSDIDSDSEDIF
jgi:hypothetical protein